MDEARSQLFIRKGLLARARVTGDTRGARDARRFRSLAVALIGRFRPRRPSSKSSRPSLVPVTQTLRIGTSNPKSALGVGLRHGIEGMVELGSRGQLELRAGSDLAPSTGFDQPPDGARHFTNWATGGLSLTRTASVRVDGFEETSERGLRGHKPGDRWRERLGFGWHPNQLFRVGPSASPSLPPYRTAVCCRAQSRNRPISVSPGRVKNRASRGTELLLPTRGRSGRAPAP